MFSRTVFYIDRQSKCEESFQNFIFRAGYYPKWSSLLLDDIDTLMDVLYIKQKHTNSMRSKVINKSQ